jgi:hypothetical protein
MSRRLRRLAFALPAAALIAAAAAPAAAAGPAGKPRQLTIAFTGDVSGYLEPCG